MTQNIFSVCKAEKGSDVVASLTDDNAADGNLGKSFGEMWMVQYTRLEKNIDKEIYGGAPVKRSEE